MAITRIGNPAIADQRGVNFRNIIINGGMDIAQRGTSVSGITSSSYNTIDRMRTIVGSQGTWTQSQSTDVPTGQGFAKSFKLDCTTADASPSASDSLSMQQKIEGQNVQYLKKGTSSAESLTCSFWVKSNKTGTYILEIDDADNGRNINKSYTISSANTWEKKTITFPGDTSGALDNDNATSLQCKWWLGAGSDFTSGTLQTSWGSTVNANRAVGQVNLADSTSNEWYVTGAQLEAGSVASDFEFLPVDVNLGRCQRYYFNEPNSDTYHVVSGGSAFSASLYIGLVYLPVSLRNTPSLVTSGNFVVSSAGSDFTASNLTLSDSSGVDLNVIQVRAEMSGATIGRGAILRNNNDANAIFALNSEL